MKLKSCGKSWERAGDASNATRGTRRNGECTRGGSKGKEPRPMGKPCTRRRMLMEEQQRESTIRANNGVSMEDQAGLYQRRSALGKKPLPEVTK